MSCKSRLTAAAFATLSLAGAWSPNASACGIDPFLGIICIAPYNFAPRGYAFTNGQLLPIVQNTALFSLLGTTYGGDGRTTFALPDTRGRVIIGAGQGPGLSNYVLGQLDGQENVILNVNQMPAHTHAASTAVTLKARGVSSQGNADSPSGNAWAAKSRAGQYSSAAPDVDMSAGAIQVSSATTSIGLAGGNQPVSIVQPYVVLNPIIALEGIFPARN
ncbi:MAG: tail fiber protein [Pseudomonadota bacterium]